MSEELNPAIIKRTQDILGKYVKKPSLTEKLLKKPPFRFLFDVFGVVIRDTKCFVGLYSMEELVYENIKDRDDKMKFLQKMVDVIKLTTGSTLAIKTSKIVAGHEPGKTNELLQLMGEIIDKKLDWQTAVEQVVSGKATSKESPRKSKETKSRSTKDVTAKGKLKEKTKEKELKAKDSKTSKSTGSKPITTTKDEKMLKSKTKESNNKQLPIKERTSKGGKEPDKSLKKSVNDLSNKKTKPKKVDSQSSNKDSPSLESKETKKEAISSQKEAEFKHEDLEQKIENPKIVPSPVKVSQSELLNSNEMSIDNRNDSLQTKSSSAEKSKKSSAKSRKSSAAKMAEKSSEQDENKENIMNLDTTKSLILTKDKLEQSQSDDTNVVKQDSLTENLEQEKLQKQAESNPLEPADQREATPPMQKTTYKPVPSPSPINAHNEIKRESTFTRENSLDSNKSSLVNRPRTSLRPPSARPPSARPGAPRRRDKNIEIILQPNDQIKMSGIQVKLETFGDLDDDGENLVIIENPNANDTTTDQHSNLTESEKMMQDETLEQGHLVQQILETQKELVDQQTDASSQQKNDKDSSNNSVMRQTSARHMDNLRDVIQNITKSVNPLGKLMDFIPEDIDAMQLEFTLWRDTYTQAANELRREKSLTESAIEPMKNQLVQIEANITEYMEMIDASRVKILQNYEKILKMLTA